MIKIENLTADRFITVAENENSETIDLPLENNGSICISTLAASFPNACGLTYKVNDRVRGVKCINNMLHEPTGGWNNHVFYCVYTKVGMKRKRGDDDEDKENEDERMTKKYKSMEDDPALCKDLIVLGLPYGITDEDLKSYFEQFGSLDIAKVKTDPVTGRSKGYGFIRFSDLKVQVMVMLKRHKLKNKYCDVRVPNSHMNHSGKDKKIYVGQLVSSIGEDELQDYFGKYGQIISIHIPQPFRGMAFVEFNDPDIVPNIIRQAHIIKGTKVFVTIAIPIHVRKKFNAAKRNRVSAGYGMGYDFSGINRTSFNFGSSGGIRDWIPEVFRVANSYNNSVLKERAIESNIGARKL